VTPPHGCAVLVAVDYLTDRPNGSVEASPPMMNGRCSNATRGRIRSSPDPVRRRRCGQRVVSILVTTNYSRQRSTNQPTGGSPKVAGPVSSRQVDDAESSKWPVTSTQRATPLRSPVAPGALGRAAGRRLSSPRRAASPAGRTPGATSGARPACAAVAVARVYDPRPERACEQAATTSARTPTSALAERIRVTTGCSSSSGCPRASPANRPGPVTQYPCRGPSPSSRPDRSRGAGPRRWRSWCASPYRPRRH
jgi:hypothetical protein